MLTFSFPRRGSNVLSGAGNVYSAVWEVGMSEFKVQNFLSASGNYTVAAVKGTESYSLLQTSLKDV